MLREMRGLSVWRDFFQGISFKRDGSGVWEGAQPGVLLLAQEGQQSRGKTGSSVRVAHWAEPVCPPGVFMLPWPGCEEDQGQPWKQMKLRAPVGRGGSQGRSPMPSAGRQTN